MDSDNDLGKMTALEDRLRTGGDMTNLVKAVVEFCYAISMLSKENCPVRTIQVTPNAFCELRTLMGIHGIGTSPDHVTINAVQIIPVKHN